MRTWPKHPVIYEINTWVWLGELSRKYQRPVDLATVPEQEWDAIAALGFDAVWFMGVWERSPAGIAIANQTKGLLEDFRRALSDFYDVLVLLTVCAGVVTITSEVEGCGCTEARQARV
jgi:hypothetical protein